MMIKTLRAAGAVAVMTALTACAGGAGSGGTPQRYDLGSPPPGIVTVGQPARAPVVLTVSATALTAETGMIWRTQGSPAPQAYAQARWAAAPAQLLRQRLVDRLAPGGPVLAASVQGAAQLVVSLTAFEQVFTADGGQSEGQVAFQVALLRDNAVVGATQIRVAAPAPTQDAPGGVAALDNAATQAADALAAWLDRLPSIPPLRQ